MEMPAGMQKVYDYLKKSHIFYIATYDGTQARVRPFGAIAVFEGRIYTQTGKIKNVYRQMKEFPRIEMCTMGEGGWLRIEADVVEDDRREARTAVLDQCPSLRNMYSEDDGNCTVFYFKNVKATFVQGSKGTGEVIEF